MDSTLEGKRKDVKAFRRSTDINCLIITENAWLISMF